jgi:hypothetical protein
MQHSDFKIGLEFRYRGERWRVTDIGSRTIAAICLTEVWTTRSKANTNIKERVKLTGALIDPKRLSGPPYGVPEQVLGELAFESCVEESSWQEARRILALGVPSRGAQ